MFENEEGLRYILKKKLRTRKKKKYLQIPCTALSHASPIGRPRCRTQQCIIYK